MLTYTVGDKWLKDEGTLVFIVTQTHFQSPSSQGFRSFRINCNTGFVPKKVHDLKKLKPFSKVANKTAIMRLEKVTGTAPITYPIEYDIWETTKDWPSTIPETLSKDEVFERVIIHNWEATPVNDKSSPWAILAKNRFPLMQHISGESDWLSGRKGITTDLNGVYMVRITDINDGDQLVQIETRPEAGKHNIGPARKYWVEPQLLYPLLKGAGDFSACNIDVKEELFVFVPNKGIVKSEYEHTENVLSQLSLTANYFRAFKKLLQNRSTYKTRQKNAPFCSVYNSGTYTFAPYKVIWAELSTTFEAAVIENKAVPLIGERPYVPDHKIYFTEFTDADVAYFVCGLLNSSIVKEYVQSHTIQIQVSNIFKHLDLPRFQAKNPQHKEIIALCKKAHKTKEHKERQRILTKMNVITEQVLVND